MTIASSRVFENSVNLDTERQKLLEEYSKELLEHGIVVKKPKEFPKPNINFEVFGAMAGSLRGYLDRWYTWLELPYIYDNFGMTKSGHSDRRTWRKNLTQKYSDILNPEEISQYIHDNKFSKNRLTPILGNIGQVSRMLQHNSKFDVLTHKIEEIWISRPDEHLFQDTELWDYRKFTVEVLKLELLIQQIIGAISDFSNNKL